MSFYFYLFQKELRTLTVTTNNSKIGAHFPVSERPLRESNMQQQSAAFVTMSAAPQRRRRSTYLADATKGVVCVTAGLVCLRIGSSAAVALAGALVNAGIAKVLKKAVNAPRPDNTRKTDPGMPSSHGASLGYLVRAAGRPLSSSGAMTLSLMATIALAWRIRSGYHTTSQIIAGASLGVAVEAAWYAVVTPRVMPLLSGGGGNREIIVVAVVLLGGAVAMYGKEVISLLRSRSKRDV